jgi:PucR family transcriptional regulator, purine catabolism regulatory protein
MGAGALSVHSVASRVSTLVERLHRVHQKMVDAALVGDGFDRMAELAAEELGRPVAIVVPALEVALVWPGHGNSLDELERFTAARIERRPVEIPEGAELIVPIMFGQEIVGIVALLEGGSEAPPEASEFLHLAATASATAYALEEARERDTRPGRLVADLLAGSVEPGAAVRRASAAGCDLRAGVVASATELRSSRPREAAAVVPDQCPEALAEIVGDRLYTLLPQAASAEALAERLRAYGPTAISSSYTEGKDVGRALHEAELMLDVIARDAETAREIETGSGSEVYRLLFRVLASRPEEVLSFYEDTIAPLARYDSQYSGELVATLEAYLANDCNMNATARAIYAHRHTVAYRLERVKELTRLDPASTEDRERLGLGLKALRIVERELPR